MREVSCSLITQVVKELCIQACCVQTTDIKEALHQASQKSDCSLERHILNALIENGKIAKEKMMPLCQDTGMSIVFAKVGQDVRLIDGDFEESIQRGIALGYSDGFLRKSIVKDPLFQRQNTMNNTPAVIHTQITQGDKIELTVCAKGFGSENKSALKMLVPADGIEGVKKFFLETIKLAGPNACPPIIVGMGIGGSMEKACLLAKQATLRPITSRNPHPSYAQLEEELLELANQTGIGAQGLGGNCTAFAINIEWYPTHIAGLPVAINISCHATRHSHQVI